MRGARIGHRFEPSRPVAELTLSRPSIPPRRSSMTARCARTCLAVSIALAAGATPRLGASFHEMQVEQALGGACGRVDQQAIQLRMRSSFQNFVGFARLFAFDAAGANKLLLLDFPDHVANGVVGDRVLVATPQLAAALGGPVDAVLGSPIPASYLEAGRLTFEDEFGTIYWSLAWGGTGYTGSTAGLAFNDADGEFGPPVAAPLADPASRAQRFTGAATALSTGNSADYALTAGEPTLTNNADADLTLVDCVFGDGFELGDADFWVAN
jgi:hypothetical protein